MTLRRRMATKTEEKEGDNKEKPRQEKGCRCLQSFTLWCGQFQVPSPKYTYLWCLVLVTLETSSPPIKPSNKQLYVHAKSYHPPSTKKAIAKAK